jgi:hypothetical protein
MKVALFHLGLACCAASVLTAQNTADTEPRTVRGRVAWFISTSLPEGLENPVRVMTGKDLVEVTLSKRSPSAPVKIPPDGILRLVRRPDVPAGLDQPPFVTLAQATVPEEVGKALVILMPLAQPRGNLLFSAKVQDLAKFNGGDWLFMNLTTANVGVDMGTTNMEIKPGQSRIYNSPASTEPILMPIRYRYFHPTENAWKMLSASTVGIVPSRREICIFSYDERYKRIDYHGITFPDE